MVSTEPLVSVVTPSYNQGSYIEATLQSVLQQDYANLEYIVIDKESNDNTLEVLRTYAHRLRWISEQDHGQADAINKGFRMAKGEILGWLNSDDLYLPGTVRKIAQYFQSHPDVDMVYGEAYHVDTKGNIIERYVTEPFDLQRLSEICFICQPTVFFRRDVFREIGPLRTDLHYCLDYDYWIRIAKRFRVGYLAEYLAHSRLHMRTKTLSKRVEVHAETLRVVKQHYGHVPVTWVYGYAAVYLTEKLMPNIFGISKDGWASHYVRVFLRHDWQRCSYLLLHGQLPRWTNLLPLRITLGDQVVYDAIVTDRAFVIKICLGKDHKPQGQDTNEVTFYAGATPLKVAPHGDTRRHAYRLRKLSLVEKSGQERVLYAERTAYCLLLVLPVLFVWQCWRCNHIFPYRELWEKGRKLWHALHMKAF